jgi:hypothetical protein
MANRRGDRENRNQLKEMAIISAINGMAIINSNINGGINKRRINEIGNGVISGAARSRRGCALRHRQTAHRVIRRNRNEHQAKKRNQYVSNEINNMYGENGLKYEMTNENSWHHQLGEISMAASAPCGVAWRRHQRNGGVSIQ